MHPSTGTARTIEHEAKTPETLPGSSMEPPRKPPVVAVSAPAGGELPDPSRQHTGHVSLREIAAPAPLQRTETRASEIDSASPAPGPFQSFTDRILGLTAAGVIPLAVSSVFHVAGKAAAGHTCSGIGAAAVLGLAWYWFGRRGAAADSPAA